LTEENIESAAKNSAKEAENASTQKNPESNETTETQNFQKEKTGLQDALVAERRKRQDAESFNRILQQQNQAYQTKQPVVQEEEDEYTKDIKNYTSNQIQIGIKTAIERQYIQSNQQMLEQNPVTGKTWLEEKLEPILRKKPYLASAIQSAENRYARAMEIINDYTPNNNARIDENSDSRKRIEENSNQPGNPSSMAKSANTNKIESLRSMSRKQFSDYRAKLRGRAPNIK